MKLSKTQHELLKAMRKGAICHYMPYAGRFNPTAYYLRNDTHQSCTATAKALLARGLVERFGESKYNNDHKLRIKP